MDILIKGMNMPKYCFECPIHNPVNGSCQLGVETYGLDVPKRCHLVELPPHGRLKDESDILRIFDKYLPKVDDDTNALLCEILAEIHLQVPTVLEAST